MTFVRSRSTGRISMQRASRPVDSWKQIERLENKHAVLKEKVAELDHRAFLTASEQVERVRLKKEKLATKDQLTDLRRTG
jgi:hypothetical protein